MNPASHRDQLVAMLAEAAEIEHCLMCTYLYAAFSLKQREDEGLLANELEAVQRWRGEITEVAIDEMLHLALVNNLLVAIGARPHYRRFNFPISPGLFPADVAVALAPLDAATLDHFIYLERPRTAEERDAARYAKGSYTRIGLQGRLMDAVDDYATVGELYECIGRSFEQLAAAIGEKQLLVGPRSDQLCDADVQLSGLCTIASVADAQSAVGLIIHQGEGSSEAHERSHYTRFSAIRDEWRALLSARPAFVPARPAARNPVMRSPVVGEDRVQILAEPATSLLDVGNVSYTLMLRLLALMSDAGQCRLHRTDVMRQCVTLMHAVANVGTALTGLPANDKNPGVNAGLTFTVSRTALGYQSGQSASALIAERLGMLADRAEQLVDASPALASHVAQWRRDAAMWAVAAAGLPANTMEAPMIEPAQSAAVPAPSPPPATGNADVAVGKTVTLSFDTRRCIHSRHCVLGEPEVFLANTPGEWLFPDRATPERIAIVANNCPSGAIQYQRNDGQPGEVAPCVNVLRLRENGPLAVHAEMLLRHPDGTTTTEFRATLCRCGQSQNKPFCDGAHVGAGFAASGEPVTRPSEPLAVRKGALAVTPLRDGPLDVSGPVEICAGTGRTIDRVTSARLCRCGQSQSKPFCDGSHRQAGFTAAGT
jgi:CDGSH-type Zn-finger protein/uncharacterized Fe-S cluster protein YjdI